MMRARLLNSVGARRARIVIAGGLSGGLSAAVINEVLFGGNVTHRLIRATETDPLKVLIILTVSMVALAMTWLGVAFTVANVAARKGYPRGKWLLIGLAGGVVALSAALAMNDRIEDGL